MRNRMVVRIDGGLGNQMSQYAFYTKIKRHYPNVNVYADYSTYKKNPVHNGFELIKIFDINSSKLPQASFLDIQMSRQEILGGKIIMQQYASGYPEDEQLYALTDNRSYYFHGTWHSFDYSEVMTELRRDFTFKKGLSEKNQSIKALMDATQSVSIHVRRGDYIKEGLDIIGKDYYFNAIQLVQNKCKETKLDYFIFSDDKEYIHSFFDFIPENQLHIVAGNTGKDSYLDMQLMSSCKHNIIANSTFSYWAAMLNPNIDKIVVKPFMQTAERESWNNEGWFRLK